MIGSEGRNDGKPAPVVVDRKPCSGSDKEEGGRRGQLRTGRACGVRGGTHTLAAGTQCLQRMGAARVVCGVNK